jgi:hypothetical protein
MDQFAELMNVLKVGTVSILFLTVVIFAILLKTIED